MVCREGPARVLELVQMGTEFTRNNDGSLHLTKEGGHSKRRVVHAADLTGREIERALLATARAHPNIRFYEHHLAIDLVTDEYEGVPHCFGADVLDQRTQSMTRWVGAGLGWGPPVSRALPCAEPCCVLLGWLVLAEAISSAARQPADHLLPFIN